MTRAIVLLFAALLAFGPAWATQASDDKIYDQVRLKLVSDPDVKGGALDVQVKDGVVTLRGDLRPGQAEGRAPDQEGEGRSQRGQRADHQGAIALRPQDPVLPWAARYRAPLRAATVTEPRPEGAVSRKSTSSHCQSSSAVARYFHRLSCAAA